MRGGAMRSILIIGTLTLVGIAGLWFLFGDSTEVFELLYIFITDYYSNRRGYYRPGYCEVWRKETDFFPDL